MSQNPSKTPLSKAEELALAITGWIGSIPSVIAHTFVFVGAFVLVLLGADFDRVLLVLTTLVSLEAIYLSIFIQMSVNYQTRAIANVEKDIDEIQEDVEEIQEDVEDIAEDVEEMQEDIEEVQEDIDEIQEDFEGLQEEEDEETKPL